MDDHQVIANAQLLDDLLETLVQAAGRRDDAASALARAEADVAAAVANVRAQRNMVIGATVAAAPQGQTV